MNILVLTPIYPSEDQPRQTTPVVHYFTKEWVKSGHRVIVVHIPSNFPKWIYLLAKPFQRILSSHFGAYVRVYPLSRFEYELDGVTVLRLPLTKIKPHGRYSPQSCESTVRTIIQYCKDKGFVPDNIVGHWFNPVLDLLSYLKSVFDVSTTLAIHNVCDAVLGVYKNDFKELISFVDVLAFRSDALKREFERIYFIDKPSVMCYSGLPESALMIDDSDRSFENITNFIFVGELIHRKFPAVIVNALIKAFPNGNFKMKFVGVGHEDRNIIKNARKLPVNATVDLLGRLPREEVFDLMKNADIFIMISQSETFGLVYLEAMAQGCITIASRDEGFDGIIKHGENGFLCKAGSESELVRVLNYIERMSPIERKRISDAAIMTAREMTDKKCANTYLSGIMQSRF